MPHAIDNFSLLRLHAVQKKFPDYHVDGILFSNISNIRYLSGFTGSDGLLVLSSDDARLLVDGRYTTQAAAEVRGISVLHYQNKIQGIEQALKELGLKNIGFEASCVTVEMYNDLTRRLKNIKLVGLGDELRLLRAYKDQHEIAVMKKAAAIASKAIDTLAREIRPGWTELETALQLEITARLAGAEQVAFETIIASGENAALPHAQPTNRKIRSGDFVVIDFGVKYQGYCSDETCTFAIGELTGDKKNAYRAVLRAHDEAILSLRAGIAAADVDALVRGVLGKKYSRYFVHGTGHGVGLEVHEAPRLAPNSQDVLNAGMVVTVEPGLYYPGLWGIRIEDTVVVKKNSCEIISKMKKDLIVVE
ncbi:MAG: integrase [Deltaproteobacteria bacterium HGW-Deltaproteobacteria-6]|jgi:Xaa-Pro aminopeptidase/Xaa-Pro dipeptidase|nr:MAG: integrase [Deltaproteobacteria bacterium HGW-Deltaproteobacteria-6]